MLTVLDTFRELRFHRPDRVAAWLGPALRGVIARRFKDAVCRQPEPGRSGRWIHCKGCPLMAGCPYGETVEPDPPAGAAFVGQADAARPIVIAPEYPADARGPVRVRVTFIGARAIRHAAAFWGAAAEVGAVGLFGPESSRFDIIQAEASRLTDVELPLKAEAVVGIVPRLRLALLTPLCIEETVEGTRDKRLVRRPTFATLFRASLRVLASLHRMYGEPLADDGFAGLKAAAERVRTTSDDWRRVEHRQYSNRRGSGMAVWALWGGAEFADVPVSVARWVMWGGRVHVGTHRVKGYGGWRVEPELPA